LVDSAVFTDDLVASEMTAEADSEVKALELAIVTEKDSILFYYELKEILPRQEQGTISRIITEEKAHLIKLTELKKKFDTSLGH
jgi:rubrerythrin